MSTPQISIAGSPAREHSDFNALNKSEFFTAIVQTPPNTQKISLKCALYNHRFQF